MGVAGSANGTPLVEASIAVIFPQEEPKRLWPLVTALTILALALRLYYIDAFPIIPFGDSYGRLLHSPQLVQGVWLPGYQLPMAALTLFTRDLQAHRALNALQSALACGGMAFFMGRVFGPWAGGLGGALLAVSPVFLMSAMGLYQEGLFAATATFGLGLVAAEQRRPGSDRRGMWAGMLLIAWASMTRYEGWFIAGLVGLWLLAGWRWPQRALPQLSRRGRGAALALLAAGPALWLLVNRAISPHGTRSLSIAVDSARVGEQLGYFAMLIPKWVGWEVIALAGLGVIAGLAARRWRAWAVGALAFGGLVFMLLVVARPYAPPDNWRQLHIPLCLCVFFVAPALWALARPAVALGLTSPWGPRLLIPLALLLLLPPWKMMESAPRWFGQGKVAEAARMGAQLREPLSQGGSLLVLGGAGKDYEAGECQATAVFAQLPRHRVICTHELEGVPADAMALREWMAAEGIRALAWVAGFDELTPAHTAIKAWRKKEPPWAQRVDLFRGNRVYLIEVGGGG